jgi:hypothetical protein
MRTPCHLDASRLHNAVIVNEFHKGAQTSNTPAVFVIFQPHRFIITIITRIQTHISSNCELFHKELCKHASCVVQIPQRIQLCIVCET